MKFARRNWTQIGVIAVLAGGCGNCTDSADPLRPAEAKNDGGWIWNETRDAGRDALTGGADEGPNAGTDDGSNAETGDAGGPSDTGTNDAAPSGAWNARPCRPGEQACADPAFPVCQYVQEVGGFRCFAGGEVGGGESCEVSDDWPENCEAGTHCVESEDGDRCARLCDPNVQTATNCPYGCKPGSDFGLNDPDLGFCIIPTGQPCVDEPRTIRGECDVFNQNCGEQEFCDVVVVGGTQPFEFATACLEDDGQHTQGAKQTCSASGGVDCAPGLKCHEPSQTCRFLCRLHDGLGCTDGEYCAELIGNEFGMGMCQPGSCQQ